MSRVVGIDLGTTNSCVAVLENGQATVIPNELGDSITPSVVAFKEDGTILVGSTARRQAITNPRGTFYGVKRLIGRRFDSAPVAELVRTMPYEIVRAPNGDAWLRVAGRDTSPPEISAYVLAHLKRAAESYLGEPVDSAVITVPAYFDDAQRQATKDAGRIAGLEVSAILNEPTAAALAYGVQNPAARANLMAVFDLGGGTFDISILRVEDGVFEVLATSGDTFLGGDDFDRSLMEALLSDLRAQSGVDLSDNPTALQRLREAAEQAKHELSTERSTEVNLPFIAVAAQGPLHLRREVDRAWLEELTGALVGRMEGPCRRALEDAGLEPEAVQQVVLVGGMTRMPAVERRVAEIFGRKPIKGVNPEEIVAVGAATQSAIMTGGLQEAVLLDVTSHTLGIRTKGGRLSAIIPRNTTIPVREARVFATTVDQQDFVTIEVFQGDGPSVDSARLLGNFVLGDLPRAKAGAVHVLVGFSLDADGILQVDATEVTTGKATSQRILSCSGLSADAVERLARARSGVT